MMEDSRPYLEEKGLAEIHDNKICSRSHVSLIGESVIERGIKKVRRDDPIIEQFLAVIPDLCGLDVPCGLVWHENLCPNNGCYDSGVHYLHTGQPSQKSAHGLIEFYRDQTSGAEFALKILQKKDAFHAEEVHSRLHLQHENIADVYGIFVRFGTVHILMEHAGKPLVEERSWFAKSPDRMLHLGKQGFRALKFLHVKGYVHCDIKPDNLMVVRDGNSFILKVIDFGTCRQIKAPLLSQAHTTWQYWPPELWKARKRKETFLAEASMDVFAMSLTLYFVQMGSHLMLNLPKEAMISQPEYVKMMGIPESIPPDLRVVMNHCLEVNKVRRCTAEEAESRLLDSEQICHGHGSCKEIYLANINNITSGGRRQVPLIDNLIQQSGSSKSQLAQVPVRNNKTLFQNELTRGPEAVRFERKTSKIFQELKKIEDQKSSWMPRSKTAVRPSAESGESSRTVPPVIPLPQRITPHGVPQYGNEIQGSYPYASLLEKIAHDFKTQPKNSQNQVKELPIQEIPQTLGVFDKTKPFSSISRQKSRTKVRQKSYDRNLNAPKTSGRKLNNVESKITLKAPAIQPKSQKLWPLAEVAQDTQDTSCQVLNTTEDDMDCVIDVFDPAAFQQNKEDDITDYMFELVEKQELEEGPERIRLDMDGMSLSGPEVNRQDTGNEQSTNQLEKDKTKNSDDVSTTDGIPNFDLLS